MRGVHKSKIGLSFRIIGSSPHARGPPDSGRFLCKNIRIIPACAGSTPAKPGAIYRNQDHPRMRGVHLYYYEVIAWKPGSSPHARGPHMAKLEKITQRRIIPACAGSTYFCGKNCYAS